jgi:tripartite-type tricarboxylate transporter receptor subunit TctC
MIESGFPGLSLGFWVGLWAPAGTPRPIVDELNRATNAALSSPQMKDSMARLGIAPSLGTVQDFEAFIADEAPRWAEIVKASGTQID